MVSAQYLGGGPAVGGSFGRGRDLHLSAIVDVKGVARGGGGGGPAPPPEIRG